MKKDQKNRQHISELMDGELDHRQLPSVMSHVTQVSGKEQWDTYHLIGDTLRSVDNADVVSKNFSDRMAARLEQEPSFIKPTKQRVVTISGVWPTAAAIAAVATGFLIAPTLLTKPAQTSLPLSLSIPERSVPAPLVLADSGNENTHLADQSKYLLWHQNSTSSLYGLRVIEHPASSIRQQQK